MNSLAVPRPVAEPLKARRRFWLAIGLMTLVQVGLRGWAAAGGWFYWDDFWWHDIVAENGVWATAGMSLGGHFSPLTYLPYYLMTAAFPYEWLPRVLVMLATLLGIDAGVLAVARRLWPTRGPQLAVYALWALSTLATPSWLWYSQFSMLGALLLTSTWTLWAYLRALEERRTSATALAVALLAVSMFAQERMVVTALLLLAFLVFVCKPSLSRLDWAGRSRLWWSSAAVMAVWAIAYFAVPSAGGAPPSAGEALAIGTGMVRVSALPALIGGPWSIDDQPVLPRADTPESLQALALMALFVIVTWSLVRNRSAWRAWAILATGVILDAGAVVAFRGGTLGNLAVGEWRYFSDLAVLAPLLLVAAFAKPGTGPKTSIFDRRMFAALLTVYAVSSVVLMIQMGQAWHLSPSRQFVQTASTDLRAAGSVEVFDRLLPTTVVNEALMLQRAASNVFSILDLPTRFDAPSLDPLWLDDAGRLVSGGLVEQRQSPGTGACPYQVAGVETVWVPLAPATDYADWGVRLDYSSATNVSFVVTDGLRNVTVSAPAGLHSLYVPMPGTPNQIGVYVTDPSASVCLASVTAGKAGPR